MDYISFSNKWYPSVLICALLYGMAVSSYNFLLSKNISSVIHLTLIGLIIVALIFKNSLLGKAVKLWAGLAILGGTLGFISIAMFMLIGKFENLKISQIITHSFHLGVGFVLFYFWDQSVKKR